MRELAEIVARDRAGLHGRVRRRGDPDPRSYRVDFGKFAARAPRAPSSSGTRARGRRELHDAYREAGLTLRGLRGPRFIRLKRLQQLREEGRLDDDLRLGGE